MLQPVLGLVVFMAVAWLCSENRRAVPLRVIGAGLVLQFAAGVCLLRAPFFKTVFLSLNRVVLALDTATTAGTTFVFGYLGGGALPFHEAYPQATFIFAFKALPLVLVVSALSALLFHWRVVPCIVRGVSLVLQKTMGVGGALGVGVAANIFVGMVEAPVCIRPYLAVMSRSELFVLMTSGMATIAGTVMFLYASILGPVIPDALGHILTASIISAPAAILIASIMVPEEKGHTGGGYVPAIDATSSMDAITKGALAGVELLLCIIGMLIVLVALVALVNQLLVFLPYLDGQPFTLQRMLGVAMRPVVWLMGVPWSETAVAGKLMGVKTVLNELLAYLDMSRLPGDALSPKSRLIMTYAMCGFANCGSLGIMMGGMGAMAPERRSEIANLGLRSIVAGTLATCMTGAVAAILL
ncbi:MAG: NupC/NupG family nucleoside CNT transporter [Desulfovibrionaceae bacterium]